MSTRDSHLLNSKKNKNKQTNKKQNLSKILDIVLFLYRIYTMQTTNASKLVKVQQNAILRPISSYS